MTTDQFRRYKDKAKQSFKTKRELFLFKMACEGRKEFTAEEFNQFEITDPLVKEYSSKYWQWEESAAIGDQFIGDIYRFFLELEKEKAPLLTMLENAYIASFEKVFPKDEFEKLIKEEGAQCSYCGITKDQINRLADNQQLFKKNLRGWSLEIDRKNSNYEYKPGNCVMACYWCNNAKTDEFTEEEFREVGKTIAGIWEKRINSVVIKNRNQWNLKLEKKL